MCVREKGKKKERERERERSLILKHPSDLAFSKAQAEEKTKIGRKSE